MAVSYTHLEQERLLRERDQAEGRQAVLAALKSQIEQWQVCLQKINTEQHQHEELIQKQKELAARLAEEKARLRANQETFQASAGLSEEKLELLHRQDQEMCIRDRCVAIEAMNVDPVERNVLVTHQFVTGATRCDSEELSVGGTDNVDVSVFESFDYVALRCV